LKKRKKGADQHPFFVGENLNFSTISPTGSHKVPVVCADVRAYSFAPRCAGFDVHSLLRGKERTKKTRQGV